MVTMTGESLEVGAPGRRISTASILQASVRRIHQAGLPLAALWLVGGIVYSALQVGAKTAGVKIGGGEISPTFLAYVASLALFAGGLSTAALRMLLGRGRESLQINAGALECVGLLAAGQGGITLAAAAYTAALKSAGTEPGAMLLTSLGGLLVYFLAIYVLIKLSLWPIGRLQGRLEMTPSRSWRLMRKATRGLILACLVFAIPFGLLMAGGLVAAGGMSAAVEQTIPALVTGAFVSSAWSIANNAIVASIFAFRVEAPASVASVFD